MTRSQSPELERFRRITRLAEDAFTLPPEERSLYLDDKLGDDRQMWHDVLGWLSRQTTGSGTTNPESGAATFGSEPKHMTGALLGPYKVLDLLGEGGMGQVYLAERVDGEVERRVAVKVIAGRRAGPKVRQKFLAERQILAGLDHANIARMFDAGTTEDGHSYLVMEYIDGSPIHRFCIERGYSLDQRLELFKKVAAAVAHAHQRLVVHRDLKPSNILVDAEGEPKLLDFGIAKLLDESPEDDKTRTHYAMTPTWASPEQMRGEPITTSTDVYSLGLLLYKLVTGRLPHDPDISIFDLARRSYETESPTRPSRFFDHTEDTTHANWPGHDLKHVRRRIRGDLDNIILKALRHDTSSRYPSVEALLEDLRRLAAGQPVSATRDTPLYLARKFVARNRWPMALLTTIGILVGAFFITFSAMEEERHVAVSEQARRAEMAHRFLSSLLGDADLRARTHETVDLKTLLDAGVEQIHSGAIEDPRIRAELLTTLAGGYSDLRLHHQALSCLDQAAAILETLDDRPALARLLMRKGTEHTHLGDISASRQAFEQALGPAEGDLERELLWKLADSDHKTGRLYDAAAQHYELLSKLAERPIRARDHADVARQIYFWSGMLQDLGLTDEHFTLARLNLRFQHLGPKLRLTLLDELGQSFMYSHRYAECSTIFEAQIEFHELGISHGYDAQKTSDLFKLGRCRLGVGEIQAALEAISSGLDATSQLLSVSPDNVRGQYHEGLGYQYRAMVFDRSGKLDKRNADLDRSRLIFERLLETHDIVFMQNALAVTLLMRDDIETAKPMVEDLLEKGWRRPDFVELAEKKGALPELIPPLRQVDTELPPSLASYIDTLPAFPMPWEEGFDPEQWRVEPDG